MARFSLILFDDALAQNWEPFTLTRPAGELLLGALTLRGRAERVLDAACALHLSGAEHLLPFAEPGAPPVAAWDAAPADGDRLFLASRALPGWEARGAWSPPDRPGPVAVGGRIVAWFAPDGTPPPDPRFFQDPERFADAPVATIPGRVLDHVWELVLSNTEQVALDIAALFPTPAPPALPPGAFHLGEHPLVLDPTVQLEPGCFLDTREGPIWLERGVTVRAFTRLCGPAYVGPDSVLLGGSIECVSLGPVCRVRGELTSSVCLGYTNKQHDGHMGHGYLGRWVNLGAGTQNSDLKNNYGRVRIWTPQGERDTGSIKFGCLLGDHVKTGIGLLLNTGTVVGAGSNLYGAAMPPKHVAPFSWGSGEELVEYRLDKFLEVAERAMARREVELTAAQREQLGRAWRLARGAREPAEASRG